MAPVRLAVIGAGARAHVYARRAVTTGAATVVAVAEPDPARRRRFADAFGIDDRSVYPDWAALADQPRLADAAVVTTPDQVHAAPAIALADQGYHLLLEKPMAPTEAQARPIVEAVQRNDVIFALCHVLRYTPYTRALRAVIASGRLGRLVSVQHLEPVGWWHQAHSFVRGQWRNSATSAPMLLTKACHDIDWLIHVMGQPVARVASFGGLAHFRPDQAPPGATENCLDCPIEPTCPYSAPRLYLGCLGDPDRELWPLGPVTPEATEPAVRAALRSGPYGRCVYASDNDVVDHQVVSLEFADGATGTLTMTAFTPHEQRKTRVFGTHGYLSGNGARLRLVDFASGREERLAPGESTVAGHGDGDDALVDAFLAAVRRSDPSLLDSDATTSLASHRVVWAAEQARLSGTVVTIEGIPR